MSLSINTNIASLQVSRALYNKTNNLNTDFAQASSGKRINSASDDPAGLAVAIDLLSQADLGEITRRNISDGVSAVTIADGSLQSASDITGRLSELATQSANGTLSDSQRQALDQEYQALKSELDRISGSTEFNGKKLLDGSGSLDIQVGTDSSSNSQIGVALPNVSSEALGLPESIATQDSARAAIDKIGDAQASIDDARSNIGATSNRLETAYENIVAADSSQQEAASRIFDADLAQVAANLATDRIGQQAAVAVQAQANLSAETVLKLLS